MRHILVLAAYASANQNQKQLDHFGRSSKEKFLKITNLKIEQRVYYKLSYKNGVACTNLTLVIKLDYTWVIKVFGETVPPESECFDNFPGALSLDILENFGIMLQVLKLCKAEDDFTDVLARHIDIKEPFPGVESERIALAE